MTSATSSAVLMTTASTAIAHRLSTLASFTSSHSGSATRVLGRQVPVLHIPERGKDAARVWARARALHTTRDRYRLGAEPHGEGWQILRPEHGQIGQQLLLAVVVELAEYIVDDGVGTRIRPAAHVVA